MLPPPSPSRFLALLLLASWATGAEPARAAFITEGSSDAANRSSVNYNLPYPPGPTYTLSRGDRLQAGVDLRSAGSYHDAGLKFALGSAIVPGQAITSAILTLNVAELQSYAGDRSVTVGLTAFGTTAALLSLADFAGTQISAGSATVVGDFDQYGFTGSDEGRPLSLVTFDVTSVLNRLLANGASSVGFVLTQPSNNGLFFSPPGASNPAYQPTLTITTNAVPAPPAAVLLLLGALGVGPLARARRR